MTESRSPSAPVVPVVCGIILRGALFLAALRAPGRSNAGLWEFPGGKVRRNETKEDALVRELREELDIEVVIKRQLTPNRHSYSHLSIDLTPFICSIVKGKPLPHEHAEIRWIDRQAAPALMWAPADVPILKEFLALP